ncbi:hypothetical protein [Aliivibrio fischeri]|uniref:Lipoprotein n=1 Tax=Aliivibrio fischeri TaxID=668 RepID=A0A510UIE2_ALIFS|nr:hypothetical protein [Aliivibrio fischeri]GEK14404.1 lipoprotein [Aliivibrio fischeri]
MKKVSLLAASVALALVGCGGSDGGSDTNTGTPSAGGIIITGFDGYFKNAVVFLDSNIGTKGQLDQSDTILGLTNTKGQITLPKGTDLSTGTIALQTLKPGDVVKLGLGDRIAAATNKVDFASDYSDTYTTDMDLPGQPMEHSVVFRSQQTGDNVVISPITDLVALQAPVALRTDVTPEQKVCDSLFGENEVTDKECTAKLYSDFTQTDPKLHKTAQILTDTKAKNTNYTAETALKATVVAAAAVETLSPDELKDPTVRTDVTIADNGTVEDTPPTFTESKPLLTAAKYNEVQNAFDSLNIKTTKEVAGSKGTLLTSINISDLFTMHNGKTVEIDKSKVSVGYALDNKNQSFYGRINDKNEFELYQTAGQSITSVGKVNVIFTTANGENNTTANFSFNVQAEAGAVKPTIDTEYLAEAKETLTNLPLIVGQPFNNLEEMTLSADALFNETVKTIELSSNANAIGLTIKLDEYQKDIIISGIPTSTAKAGEYYIQLRAIADNSLSSEVIKLELPAIVEGMISVNQNEVKLLQDQIDSLDLTVGDLIDHEALDLDITPLFNSNVTEDIEYYAGLEFDKKSRNNHEYYTTIPGVRVYTDEVNGLGTLTILGTPKEATKGGYFYVAAGINPDAENEIISEMVKITLPDVKPADEVIPPPQPDNNVSMENTFLYESAVESIDNEDGQYLGSGVSCEVRYFMSDGENTGTGEMFSSIRTVETFDECPTISKDTQPNIDERFESFGKYTVDSNHVINLQMEEEYRDENGDVVLDDNEKPLMEKGNIYLSAKMFDNKFITTLQETMTPPVGYGEPYSWLYSYAASTSPNSANAIMAEWNKLEDGTINQLENTIYFTDESGNIQPLRVDATMNSVDQNCSGDMCESGSTDADIFIKNMSCDLVKDIYSFDGYSISESPISWGYWDHVTNSYIPNINFYPQGDSCGVDFTSDSDISLGIHTLHGEVNEKYEGKYQDIMFSFKKD